MARKFGSFTIGAQLIETFGLMFAAGLKPMLWLTGTLLSVSLAWLLWHDMRSEDFYRCTMRVYAWLWEYLKFDPAKPVMIVGPGNTPVKMPIGKVDDYIPVRQSWQLLITTISAALQFTAIIALPACLAYTWASRWLGRKMVRRDHERGATLAPVGELVAQIEDANNAPRKAERVGEYARVFGPGWKTRVPFMSRAELVKCGVYEPYTIAGVPYPWRAEQTHMFSLGTTGTGKSTMMRDLLDQIRQRRKKAVVFDLTGTFIESFYDAERDVILNPFDARCPQWSIFNDCATRAEFTSAAEALIPSDGGGAEPFWVQAARILLVEACVRLTELGLTTNADLYNHLMTATLKQVNAMVGGSIASPLTDPAAARMAESIRATMNTNINAIQCLPKDGEYFSVKDWVAADQPGGSVLFISARHVDLSTVRVLLTLWMDMTINAMMSGPTSPRDVRIWFLFDELGALHRLPAIEKGMQTARNYGGAFVLGVHTIAKLRDTYGDKIAETLGSLARTKLILATADYTSATWCSQQIGNGEWREMEQGYSFGHANVRDAITLTNKRQLEPLVLPDDISKLPDLSGWLVFPQGFPAAKVRLEIRKFPVKARGFIPRPPPAKPADAAAAKPAGPSGGGDEGGVGIAATTATVALPAPAAPTEPELQISNQETLLEQIRQLARMMPADGLTLAGEREALGPIAEDAEQAQDTAKKADAEDALDKPQGDRSPLLPGLIDPASGKDGARKVPEAQDLTLREVRQDFGDGRDGPEEDLELGQ